MKYKSQIFTGIICFILGFLACKQCSDTSPEIKYIETELRDTAYLPFLLPRPPIYIESKGKTEFEPIAYEIESESGTFTSESATFSESSATFSLNFLSDSLDMPFQLPETNLFASTPFVNTIDTVINGNIVRSWFLYPELNNKLEFIPKADTVNVPTITKTVIAIQSTPFYNQTWFRITTHAIAILGTAYVVSR